MSGLKIKNIKSVILGINPCKVRILIIKPCKEDRTLNLKMYTRLFPSIFKCLVYFTVPEFYFKSYKIKDKNYNIKIIILSKVKIEGKYLIKFLLKKKNGLELVIKSLNDLNE